MSDAASVVQVDRLGDGPIIHAGLCDSIGANIQGPSLVRMPDWAPGLGRYHLYFADHKGAHIRLAYADDLVGPWRVHGPGSLQLADSHFLVDAPEPGEDELAVATARWRAHFGADYSIDEILIDAVTPHIASPDVHVDHDARRFRMYFHGLDAFGVQVTRVALSTDGIGFEALPEVLGASYFRVFDHDDHTYALVMPGQVRRSADGLTGFVAGSRLFGPSMRHSAVLAEEETLHVLWTRVGDAPESILYSTVDLRGDWLAWADTGAEVILRPELAWEGANASPEPSRRGAVHGRVNQLRDPCLFVDTDDQIYLAYAGGGESAIGLARINLPN